MQRLGRVVAVVGLLVLGLGIVPGGAFGMGVVRSAAPAEECEAGAPGFARCYSFVRQAPGGRDAAAVTGSFYKPSDLQAAYNLPSATAGQTQTVAVVGAYDDPSAEADLGVYRAQFGLPACTTANGCFRKVDQNGGTAYPSYDASWAESTASGVELVSAICPNCHILLVEATDSSISNLLNKATTRAITLGATVISGDFGITEFSGEEREDAFLCRGILQGMAMAVPMADSGYGAPSYPAASACVTAVGGTTLHRDFSTTRGWSETVYHDITNGGTSASGCSAYIAKPSWQHDTLCAGRTDVDVAANAGGDYNSAMAIYVTSPTPQGLNGWYGISGMGPASRIIAGVYALAGNGRRVHSAYHLYTTASASNLYDITSGSDGSCGGTAICTALPGYDGPTGLGTPNGTSAF